MMTRNDTYTITRGEYFDLRMSEARLDMLEAYGVDNWQGYGYCFRDVDGPNIEEIERGLRLEIFEQTKVVGVEHL